MADGLSSQLGDIGSESITDQSVSASDQAFIGTGSPVTYGQSVLSGQVATTPGSVANVTFGNAFAAAPQVSIGALNASDRTVTLEPGSLTTTGFTALSHGAGSILFSWIAVGSGQI